MSFTTIKAKMKELLESIEDIEEVSDYPNQNFNGFPAAMVRTNGNTSDYETTSENDEVYDFTIYLFQNLDNPVIDMVKGREIMEGLCDTVRDTFDKDEFLDGIELPTDRTMLGVKPTVSKIFEEESGKYVVSEIDVAVRVSKQI